MMLLEKLQNSRNALGLLFMLPAAVLLLLFLTYPLGLALPMPRSGGPANGSVWTISAF